jgi:hypothetical protein
MIERIHIQNGNIMLGMLALARVHRFCSLYGSDANPDTLVWAVFQNLYKDTPDHFLFTTEHGRAHMLFALESYYGGEFRLSILQTEIDKNCQHDRAALYLEGMKQAAGLCKSLGLKKIRIMARNQEVAEKFSKRIGFKDLERAVMEVSAEEIEEWMARAAPQPQ